MAPDALEQRRGGALVLEGNRQHPAATRQHPRGADDALDRPVAALDQHVGARGCDQRFRRVVVEPGDRADRLERGDERQAVVKRVYRALAGLAEPPRRGIAVQRDEQRGSLASGAREIGRVATVQDVEHAVGEDERPRQRADPALELARIADLRLEGRRLYFPARSLGAGRQRSSVGLQYSKAFTTLRTPPVVRAISTASSASGSLTRPIR